MKLDFGANEIRPIHVIGKCSGPAWPVRKMNDAWRAFGSVLKEVSGSCGATTHAFVMMRNHYHWLVSLPQEQDPEHTFERVAQCFPWAIHFKIIRLDHIEAYRQAYAYVYRNPVAAGIVTKAETYPYSTLPYVLGRTRKPKLKFHCIDNMNLIYDPHRMLKFINGGGGGTAIG
jgi:putative transposase